MLKVEELHGLGFYGGPNIAATRRSDAGDAVLSRKQSDQFRGHDDAECSVLVELVEVQNRFFAWWACEAARSVHLSRSHHLLFGSFSQPEYQHGRCEQRDARKNKTAAKTSRSPAHFSHRIRPHKAAKVPDGVDQSNPRRRRESS
jgi:hypothetical protein